MALQNFSSSHLTMASNAKNLTQYEIPRLPEVFNLTDGHIHRKWDRNELKIIERAGDIFKHIDREKLPEIEAEYLEVFYKLAGQKFSKDNASFLLCTSASMSLEIVANYLRLNNLGLALIEPCFDNLADIFRRHNIELELFEEKYLFDENVGDFLKTLKSDLICLVTPNNPTGASLSQENLEKIAQYCK
jgi:histidinol-phosphate/aromatic aminotransferase/cobyric acid decarboxylase-like protein